MVSRRQVVRFVLTLPFVGTTLRAASQEVPHFYVAGFVKTPGSFVWEHGLTVRAAIAGAGGITERGSLRGIQIVRKVDGVPSTLDVTLDDTVLANDTVRVRRQM